MLQQRLIPCLLLSGNRLVKTRRFRDARYVGDPVNVIKIFNEKSCDELIVLDIDASKAGSGPNYSLIEEIASECFMPLTYGGGVRDKEGARRLFSLGVEKVSLNSIMFDRPEVINEIADDFGTQSVVASFDLSNTLWTGQRKMIFRHATGKTQRGDWIQFIQDIVARGVGEVLLTNVTREGSLEGLDLDLVDMILPKISCPLIIHGGASSKEDVRAALLKGVHAVAAGSMLVFHGPHKAVLISYPGADSV